MAGVEGRVTLVTGAGRGIGRVTTQLLSERGARVMATARSESELASLGTDYIAADLGTIEGCEKVVLETRQRLGSIEVFICNHGIGSAEEKVIWEQDPTLWEKTLDINLNGPFHLSRLITADMVKQKYGRVVYTSSTAGELAEPHCAAYNSSKHGLLGLMRSVALDCGPHGVTSNAVLPGWVHTEMAEKSAIAEAQERGITRDEVWRDRATLYPAGRVVTPEEVATVIGFLAAEESSGVSGEAIKVALGGVW